MKPLLTLFALLVAARPSGAQNLERFVGSWQSDEGDELLIVQLESDSLRLGYPEQTTWRAEFRNIRVEGDTLRFEQVFFLRDRSYVARNGMEHPFEGVINHCEIWYANGAGMHMRIHGLDGAEDTVFSIRRRAPGSPQPANNDGRVP